MKPTEFFDKPVIGKLTTRVIDTVFLEGKKSSIDSERDYEVIDVIDRDGHKMFVTNEWYDGLEEDHTVLLIHNNFVKEYKEGNPND